jgi:hypothetical protein
LRAQKTKHQQEPTLGNGEAPTNVGCQNIDSQIQGDENSVALAGVQTFPTTPPTEPEPQTCVECFTKFLTPEQIGELLRNSQQLVGHATNTIEEFCQFAESLPDQSGFLDALPDVLATYEDMPDDLTIEQLIDCLERVLGLQTSPMV